VAVIEATGLVKAFGPTVAVDGIDLTVEEGRIHGLLGPNGAGKTTVLAILFGLVVPDGGALRLFGRDAVGSGALDGVAGFVETPRFYPYLDARANLAGLAALDGHRLPAVDGRGPDPVGEALDAVALGGCDGRKVGGFSLGMRQRLGLAAALLRQPRLLIVDEPANGLDPAGMRDLRSLLRRLAAGGMTILLSSHDMPQVEDLCDGVTVLRDGRVVFDGTVEAMRQQAPDPAYLISTSDDGAALAVAAGSRVSASRHDDGGLAIHGSQVDIDDFVVALGRQGVAVRSLRLHSTGLEFFALTEAPR
jgi:ABC-2 type transport system ATP-binding protein